MNVPEMAFEKFGGDLELYNTVFKFSAAFLNDQEIADITGEPKGTIASYRGRLKKVLSEAPPDVMTSEALYGYLNMSEIMMQDMMQVYMEMREDREIFRNNTQPKDGKRRLPVHAKDMIALMQTLNKTALERAAVLTKFAAVHERKQNALPNSQNKILPNALMDSNDDVIDVEVRELR